jgi:hypothetical protein
MVWKPLFTPDGKKVIAKVEQDGMFALALNGKVIGQEYDGMYDPVIGPEGDRVLVKALEGGKYYRRVVAIGNL